MSSWQVKPLGHLCKFVGGQGFPLEYQGLSRGSVPFIKVSDMELEGNGKDIVRANNWVSQETIDSVRLKAQPVGAVVFAKIGEAIKRERVRVLTRPTVIDNNMMAAIPRDTVIPAFLFNLLRFTPFSREYGGTSLPYLRQSDLMKIQVSVPPLEEQERIASVLGAFDDLIETNRRLAASVRQLVTASYERALDAVTASRPLRDIADHRPGKYLKKTAYVEGGEYAVYGSNSVMGHHHDYLYEGPLTVLARIGSNCGALRLSVAPAWVNNNASAIMAKDPALQFRLHEALLRIEMDHHRTGSGQPFIQTDSLMEELVPWDGRVTEWDRAAKVMLSTVGEIEAETGNLTRQRDELLPLLMSGRVRVRDLDVVV